MAELRTKEKIKPIEPTPIKPIDVIELPPKKVDLVKKPKELEAWRYLNYIKLGIKKSVREGYPWPVHVTRRKSMKEDYRDLRFYDSNHEMLGYFMPKYNKKEALCFVRLTGQAITDNYIYFAYGNKNAVFKGSSPSAMKLKIDKKKRKVLDTQHYKPQPVSAIKLAVEVKK